MPPGVAATAHISRSDRHPRSDAFDLRHVAELPMVRPDAVGRRQLEADPRDGSARRSYVRTEVRGRFPPLVSMTGRTVRVECGFTAWHSAAQEPTTTAGLGPQESPARGGLAQQPHSDLKS